MLKNVKFLYSVIAVLLAICVLCTAHIAVDRSMMYEKRTHYVNTLCAQTEGVYEWIKTALDEDSSYNSVASAKNYVEALMDTAYVAAFYRFDYNTILTGKVYFGGASDFYNTLLHINDRFGLILENLSKNPVLSEDDRAYLEKAEKAFGAFWGKIETDGIINTDSVKSDTYLNYACMELYDIAR